MKIPVLNCSRVYINPNRVSLLLNSNYHMVVTNDGWEILKHCNGSNDIDAIHKIISHEFDISKDSYMLFLQNAENNNVIRYIQSVEEIDTKIYGGENRIFPLSFSFELTNRCNLECNYCYGNFKRSEGIFFDYNKVEPLFKYLSDNGVLTIELTGGEPLLHPHFKNILLLAIEYFMRVNIISNGVLFDDDIFEIIHAYKNKIALQISIDGCSEETNYMIRKVKNTWLKSLNTIKKLRDIGAKYRTLLMITSDNIHEMEGVCILFKQEDLKNLIFSPVSSEFGRACSSKECKLSNQMEEQLCNNLSELQEKYTGIFGDLFGYGNDLPIKKDNCGIGWLHATITPKGNIKSCPMLDDDISRMGNIFEQNIQDIFDSDIAFFYTNFKKMENEKSCNNCDYKNKCASCIARIYKTNVELRKRGEDLCPFVKEIGMDKYFKFE